MTQLLGIETETPDQFRQHVRIPVHQAVPPDLDLMESLGLLKALFDQLNAVADISKLAV